MATINLLSTFIASASPDTNFSVPAVIYVGTVPGLGTCTGLLQIPTLPTGNPWDSAALQLSVFTKSGASPSTVDVQKVTAPSPLDTATVTFNTPGLTIDPIVQASKSIATADVGTLVQIDITNLINSWYTTPFSGLALTCTGGSFVLFDSANSADAARRPELILTTGQGGVTNVDIVARLVDTESPVDVPVLPGADQFSPSKDISQKRRASFFFTNQGAVNAIVGIQESIDGVIYVQESSTISVAPGLTGVLSPNYYAKYTRLAFHSVDPILPTALLISYIAQT